MQIISVGEVSCAHKADVLAWFLYNWRKWWGLSIFVSCQWCVHYPSFISQHCYSHRFHRHHWRDFHMEVAGRRHPRLPFLKMTSHTGDEVASAWSVHIIERNQMGVRFKSRDEEKLRGGSMERPDEGLSFLPHRLLMMPNLQYLNTSALMSFQFYRYGQRMWLDENVKWNNRKMHEMGAAFYFITINQTRTLKKFKRLYCVWFKGSAGLWEKQQPCCHLVIWNNLSGRSLTPSAQAEFTFRPARTLSKWNPNNLFMEYVSTPYRLP